MDTRLLQLLACPYCRGKLLYDQCDNWLICPHDQVHFRIENGVPVMQIIKPAKS